MCFSIDFVFCCRCLVVGVLQRQRVAMEEALIASVKQSRERCVSRVIEMYRWLTPCRSSARRTGVFVHVV